jgi:dinuclear metal center YbgI/SA1388 family protein
VSAVRLRGLLERLDVEFPMTWAEPWDRVGLLVGDPDAVVERVFVSLDPTPSALAAAVAAGAQVLLTHHPIFPDPDARLVPGPGMSGVPFAAASAGIALVACHTNLDRSAAGAEALPAVLGLRVSGPLESSEGIDDASTRGAALMGRLCEAPAASTLDGLAVHVSRALGVSVRVWGDHGALVARVGVAPGSGRSLVAAARLAGCDVLVTGELRYHEALDAVSSGLSVIEAGHDATEWPLVPVLASAAASTEGLDEAVVLVDRPLVHWSTTKGA